MIAVNQRTTSLDGSEDTNVSSNVGGFEILLYSAYIVLIFFVYQMSSIGSPVCFDDCRGYIPLMGKSGEEFYHTMLTMFRPWAVPTFFSLFGPYDMSSAARIVLSQTYIAFFSWLLFAFASQGLIATRALKFVAFVVVSSLMFGQGYYHFNQFLLSDWLAMSSVLTQYALCFLFPRFAGYCEKIERGNIYVILYLALILVVTAFEMATRDANVLLALSGIAFLVVANREVTIGAGARWILVMLVVVVAAGQSLTARIRFPVNGKNILAGAVLPNENMRDFFFKHGMPTAFEAAAAEAKPQSLDAADIDEMREVEKKALAGLAPEDKQFFGEIGGVYAKYLLTHPEYVIGDVARHWRLIFAQTADMDAMIARGPLESPPAQKFVHPGETTPFIAGASTRLSAADLVPPVVGLALVVLCVLPPWLRPREMWSWTPLFLAAAGFVNATLGFFGDVWERSEMERHAFVGSVVLRLGLTLCVLRLIDEARRRWAPERPSVS
jgi:hypothetical protein